jgi:putative membrane protein
MSELDRDPRVYFAAERTMLAWVRTGLAMMGFGFVIARFGMFLHEMAPGSQDAAGAARPPVLSLWMGTSLIVFGVWVNLAAAVHHFRFRARFERGEPFVTPRGVMTIVLSCVLAVLGVVMTMYLLLIA